PGTPLSEALELGPDVVFELDISPNRPDAMCHAGVARDLAAALRVPFTLEVAETPFNGDVGMAGVKVLDSDRCPRFSATRVALDEVVPTPAWMARRLTLAGMRPLSPVVDVSNYVMLELGQPNHPYDSAAIGAALEVRLARPGETIVTLDGVTRRLEGEDLLICDAASKPVGIAGIMGGGGAEITPESRDIVIESAWFTPVGIARSGRRLGLHTEARARFERGVDPLLPVKAMHRIVGLLGKGARRGPVIDKVESGWFKVEIQPPLRTSRANAILGTALKDEELPALLEPIGFRFRRAGEGRFEVTVPSWRPDCYREVDLIEEIARLYGYSRIARTLPPVGEAGPGLTPYQKERRAVRDVLQGLGADEAWTTTFLAPGDLASAGLPPEGVEVSNPLDSSESLLRPSLLPGLLRAVRFNADRQQGSVRFFEIGRVFPAAPLAGSGPALEWGPHGEQDLPEEEEMLGVILAGSGDDGAPAAARAWAVLSGALRLSGVSLRAAPVAGLHPARSAVLVGSDVVLDDEVGSASVLAELSVLGALGEVDPAVVSAFGLSGRIGYLELRLPALLAQPRLPVQARALSRFPASDLDLAFIVPSSVPAASVRSTLVNEGGPLLERVELFDTYRWAGLGAEERSLAFRLRFRSAEHTLSEAELASLRVAAVEAVSSAHGARLRV
ncbi:MAG: phenylalanine--tRNA ligase subunit beta, partial [Acidimicrobiales bacterium]